MRKWKVVITLLNALLLIVGSVGVNIFQHTCEQDGTIISYFVNTENHCTGEKENLPPCCQKEPSKKEGKGFEKDCCNDTFSYLHYQPLTFFQSDELHKINVSEAYIPTSQTLFLSSTLKTVFINRKTAKPPPPPCRKYGINLLIKHRILQL
jgi:hypothetical protein